MENEGMRKASHIGLWILVLAIGGWLLYSATHSSTENNRYAPGSTSNDNHSVRWPLTIDLNFGCVRTDSNPSIPRPPKPVEVKHAGT